MLEDKSKRNKTWKGRKLLFADEINTYRKIIEHTDKS